MKSSDDLKELLMPPSAGGRLRRRRPEGGAAAVEFALVLPILLMIVFGIIQYGFYFWSMQGGSTATREAARRAAVGDPASCADFTAYVKNRIDVLGSDTSSAVINRTYAKGPGNTGSGVEVGDIATVGVTFNSYNFHLPFIPFIADGVVSQKADSRVEYVPSQPAACS